MINQFTLNLIEQFLSALVNDNSITKHEYIEIISLLEANSGIDEATSSFDRRK